MPHISVLFTESIDALALRPGMTIVDGTFGAGGHSKAIAERIGKEGRLISFDADAGVFSAERVQELECLTQFTKVVSNFRNASEVLKHLEVGAIDGALFDLGLSSTQLEESGRGFSFLRDEPLAMTFQEETVEGDVTAQTVVNEWSAETLETILKGFGEERFARAIARGIVEARTVSPITRTGELVEIIRAHTPGWYHRGRTHLATRTFQAIRMAVNDELGSIEVGVRAAGEFLRPGGRLAVISFHSIEDRTVKQLFLEMVATGEFVKVTKKPIVPSEAELKVNPRSRSAKLRIIEKLSVV